MDQSSEQMIWSIVDRYVTILSFSWTKSFARLIEYHPRSGVRFLDDYDTALERISMKHCHSALTSVTVRGRLNHGSLDSRSSSSSFI